MPVSKKLVLSVLLLLAGGVGYVVEVKTGRTDLLWYLAAAVAALMVSLWALSPVSSNDTGNKKERS